MPSRAEPSSGRVVKASKASVPSAERRPRSLTIAVVGDSLADGMWAGLYRTVQRDKRYKIYRGAKNSVGFTGSDLTDMIDRAFAKGPVHALVMMIGANDRRSFFIGSRSHALLGTPKWVELYRGRIERFMDHAARRKVPLVWILLPVMREDDANVDARRVNDIVTAAAHSRPLVLLLPTWELTADAKGRYTAHFKDRDGKMQLMRMSDGVHFTAPAYELIADRVLARLREASPHFRTLAEGAAH
ncbi:MAG: DUF459 domain-containing protein [Hyphomicrobiaceae bacterium]|nr:DUF459 domain-containing protein [Hyphomicrobiaceae bacterium]